MKNKSESKQSKTIIYSILFLFFVLSSVSCQSKITTQEKVLPNSIQKELEKNKIVLGAERWEEYLPMLAGKRVGVVTNQTGILPKTVNESSENTHLVDFLIAKNINILKIFAPEHGFRGEKDAGAVVEDGKDKKTGIPILSLYGENKKPKPEWIADLDVVVFDIQDVGVRFYTYISTLHLVMEAVAENKKTLLVLDRPNPNAHYIDGPVLQPGFQSFVGMHPVPVVYGMTIGEYAKMINGEGWLKNKIKANLVVVPLKNYTHQTPYSLPVKPSPNLPNDVAINLYPSLCFFEGTNVSEGRGTDMQFQVYGSPFFNNKLDFAFVPMPNLGAKSPRYKGVLLAGEDLRGHEKLNHIELKWLIKAYKMNTKEPFFNPDLFFDKLVGTDQLRKSIVKGESQEDIKKTWQTDLEAFKKIRAKYLMYQD